MNKEEMVNKYQELLKEYQEAEISRRKSIEEEKKLKEQKDIAEQKIEFEEAKERFESDANLSTEEIIAKAKLRQDELNKIEEARLNTQKNVKDLENKKQEIRKSAEEYNRNKEEYMEKLNRIFCYEYYEKEDVDILVFHIGYLKHNTVMAFPSVLVFKEIPDFIDYEISSKYVADVVKGTVEIRK